ncbi:MAG: EamA family transporter [Thomasclavelia sp.]|jgi:transporter family protein|nr:EamA family transporter [Thomasclavelia sp.]
MWVIYSFLSALFGGITAILAKCGIKKTDSTIATALRTIIVVIFSWLMVFIVGSFNEINHLSRTTWIFLILSGLATGFSWLAYFKALSIGDVNKVVPIDKSSTILTIVLSIIFLGEKVNLLKIVCITMIAIGTYMMIEKKEIKPNDNEKHSFIFYAILSAVFAALTSILGKVGISGVESNLGTAIRTVVVLIMAWVMVGVTKKGYLLKSLDKKELGFIFLSGIATGASWLCMYKALQIGEAGVVASIDKLSIVVSIAFSYLVFKERLSIKSFTGLVMIVVGTIVMIFI